MKVIKAAAVPPRKKAGQLRSKYRDAVNCFVRSGFECAEVTLDEGESVKKVHRGLWPHAKRAGVTLSLRGERLFMERGQR